MKDPNSFPSPLLSTTAPRALPLSRAARVSRFAIVALPSVVTVAKFLWAWSWLWSWQLSVTLLVLALVRPFIGRPLPGWSEIAATVARGGASRLLSELLKAALTAWSVG